MLMIEVKAEKDTIKSTPAKIIILTRLFSFPSTLSEKSLLSNCRSILVVSDPLSVIEKYIMALSNLAVPPPILSRTS
jgi:hypothetical protein